MSSLWRNGESASGFGPLHPCLVRKLGTSIEARTYFYIFDFRTLSWYNHEKKRKILLARTTLGPVLLSDAAPKLRKTGKLFTLLVSVQGCGGTRRGFRTQRGTHEVAKCHSEMMVQQQHRRADGKSTNCGLRSTARAVTLALSVVTMFGEASGFVAPMSGKLCAEKLALGGVQSVS